MLRQKDLPTPRFRGVDNALVLGTTVRDNAHGGSYIYINKVPQRT